MGLPVYSRKVDEIPHSPDCYYYDFDTIGSVDLVTQLAPKLPLKCDQMPENTRLNE